MDEKDTSAYQGDNLIQILVKICEEIYHEDKPNCVIIVGEDKRINESTLFLYRKDDKNNPYKNLNIMQDGSKKIRTDDIYRIQDLSDIEVPYFKFESLIKNGELKIQPLLKNYPDGPEIISNESLADWLENYYEIELEKIQIAEDNISKKQERTEHKIRLLSYNFNNLNPDEFDKWFFGDFYIQVIENSPYFIPYAG